MKTIVLSVVMVVCCALLAAPQQLPPNAQVHHPIQQEPKPAVNNTPIMEVGRKPDLTHVKEEAGELSKLVESVSSGVNQAQKGIVPKDLGQNLKKIEKLSKRLRSELAL